MTTARPGYASAVYARLLKRTEPGDEDFQFVLMGYGAERLMHRLSQRETRRPNLD